MSQPATPVAPATSEPTQAAHGTEGESALPDAVPEAAGCKAAGKTGNQSKRKVAACLPRLAACVPSFQKRSGPNFRHMSTTDAASPE